jgi:Fe2+ or Zn2+ uptake regulation protein
VCSKCGKVEFFEGDEEGIEHLIREISRRSGYKIGEHWLQLFGECRECQDEVPALAI